VPGNRSSPRGNGEKTRSGAGAADAETRRPLGGPLRLTTTEWECILPCGDFLIGRDPTCRVFVDDPLASREHARLSVAAEGAKIVDAASANGVFVNNVRISKPRRLFHGDRLLVGATEIRITSAALPAVRSAPPEERPTLSEVRERPQPLVTVRAEAVEVLGRVAERLLAAGQLEKAKTVLVDQLIRILNGARSGLALPSSLCSLAARYALKLATALHDGNWVDYTIELHLRGRCAMAPETLADLVTALENVRQVDQALFHHYAEWLTEAAPRLSGHATEVARRLSRIKLPAARGTR
jgi:hypothetical protein